MRLENYTVDNYSVTVLDYCKRLRSRALWKSCYENLFRQASVECRGLKSMGEEVIQKEIFPQGC